MFQKVGEKFITGNEAVVEGALAAGATVMAGYPITPATEILEEWASAVAQQRTKELKNPSTALRAGTETEKLKFIQAEDETSAGFNVIGAILGGAKAFTATAGPGTILMQDPIAMAEAMRIPFVGIIMQRGGPSTGTVIYSQQEVTMTCFGGNGEGLRIVYSTANPQELYDYTIKAFDVAWRYRFPTFVLGDGYQSKEKSKVRVGKFHFPRRSASISASIRVPLGNRRNCYNFEDELAQILEKDIRLFARISPKVEEYQADHCQDAETVIFAHGIVSLAAKEAIEKSDHKYTNSTNDTNKLQSKVGLFRPISLNPFPAQAAQKAIQKAKRILIVESSQGQFSRLVKSNLKTSATIEELLKPAMPISAEEIMEKIR